MTKEDVIIDQEDVQKIEEELKAKKQAEEQKRKEELAKLVEDAKKTGATEAIEKHINQQELERIKKENAELQSQLEKRDKETSEKFKELNEQIEKIKSQPRGQAVNRSPFDTETQAPAPRREFTKAELKKINDESWAAFTGQPVSQLHR